MVSGNANHHGSVMNAATEPPTHPTIAKTLLHGTGEVYFRVRHHRDSTVEISLLHSVENPLLTGSMSTIALLAPTIPISHARATLSHHVYSLR